MLMIVAAALSAFLSPVADFFVDLDLGKAS